MTFDLDPTEIRVLGALIEKDLTTPDYYPLTLSALTAACNQKSNRDPVTSLSEGEVQAALASLGRKYLVWERGGAGGRVPRYAHKLSGTLTNAFDFSRNELGVLAVLMLRGPQTPGEIRARAPRTCDIGGLGEVESLLQGLAERRNGPFVRELEREPGRREPRYAHLFGTPTEPTGDAAPPPVRRAGLEERVAALEERVAALAAELAALRESARQ